MRVKQALQLIFFTDEAQDAPDHQEDPDYPLQSGKPEHAQKPGDYCQYAQCCFAYIK
jgi:hypothetical protein